MTSISSPRVSSPLGPRDLNEKNKEIFRMDVVDDQIDTTSRAVLD